MSSSNKDEALRCLAIATRHRDNGNLEAARKFCNKSISLYETDEAITLLGQLKDGPAASTSSFEARPPSEAHSRASMSSDTTSTPTRDDSERVAVIRRIRACRATQYYEILGLKRDCTEAEIKKAYRKLAILTHPDKSDVPGAAEAFKMVARAWQILGDAGLKEQFDSAPEADPTSRQSQMGGQQFRGAAGGEMTPEQLFEMFFNGGFNNGGPFGGGFGGSPVFTASFGPNGFQRTQRRPARAANAEPATPASPFVQLLPMIILFAISFLGSLPSILNLFVTPDPGYSFSPSRTYTAERLTANYRIPYYVNAQEFTSHPIYESIPASSRDLPHVGPAASHKLRTFEQAIERGYVSSLRGSCNREFENKESRMDAHRGVFGFGANTEMIEKIRAEPMPSCQRLRDMGLLAG